MGNRTLVLWDIDLTLVDLTGIGREWYSAALANTLGLTLTYVPAFPGRTERAITHELLSAHGAQGTEEEIQAIFAELIAIAESERHVLRDRGHVLPGVPEALARLAEHDHVVQTLVTGNLAEVSHVKLAPFGLLDHIDLEIGGYGSLSAERSDLVSAAMDLAGRKHGGFFEPESVVVIGDTPHDVRAALHHGAVAIGVGTGRHSLTSLREAGAHAVFRDLSDTEKVLSAVLDRQPPGGR
ncbi:HAD family hydrolase [Kibdelosporangium phytohabitans]|uniref:Haloacid dehalogenase n=1 Tax=Kibdelosporangium phytohabitans TaxID=860235 RepID=A0A0N9IA76_9PSEU|nr:haloacid dehalogenase-like hydrolase [Kibdelosporangium phytohabitans]ALG12960.1 haloacid dehalogenase [Kibdelosporangium phytohabitans]MBE1464673.1 phosphoglycolate phosphatase-like HAD superfamily hydrolase [Kibdelosporangium phytohabitans]